ncbi:hypothetical protein AB0O67_07605 [Streptomyces sp. NPDC086077]
MPSLPHTSPPHFPVFEALRAEDHAGTVTGADAIVLAQAPCHQPNG